MTEQSLVPAERITSAIVLVRGHKVMLDSDLAAMYGVETKDLVRAVKRNIDRFPDPRADGTAQTEEALHRVSI